MFYTGIYFESLFGHGVWLVETDAVAGQGGQPVRNVHADLDVHLVKSWISQS